MALLDVEIPEGALAADADQTLLASLTDMLLPSEGADPVMPGPGRSPGVTCVGWL